MLQFKDNQGLHDCKIVKNTNTICIIEVSYWGDYGVSDHEKVLSVKRNKDILFLDGICIL